MDDRSVLDTGEIERLAESLAAKLPFAAPETVPFLLREYLATAWSRGAEAGIQRMAEAAVDAIGGAG